MEGWYCRFESGSLLLLLVGGRLEEEEEEEVDGPATEPRPRRRAVIFILLFLTLYRRKGVVYIFVGQRVKVANFLANFL